MLVTFDTKKVSNSNAAKSAKPITSSQQGMINTLNSIPASTISEHNVLQNVKVDQLTDAKEFKFTKRRTNYACITCKIRRKKCSEERPICSDCKRLGKTCVWATDDMSVETIRELKKKVEEEEMTSKGKRKASGSRTDQKKKPKKVEKKAAPSVDSSSAFLTPSSFSTSSNDRANSNTSNSKLNTLLNSDIFQRHDDLLQRSQTPIASHLLNMSNSRRSSAAFLSPQLQPQFNSQDLGHSIPPISQEHPHTHNSIPDDHHKQQQIWSNENFYEFSNFFESNIRLNSKKLSSNRIVSLDDNDEEIPVDEENTENNVHNNNQLTIPTPTAMTNEFSDLILPPNASPGQMDSFSPFNFDILNPLSSSMPTTLNLDPVGNYLYDYYINRLSGIVSIVPQESNYYLKCFLPMAAQNQGILNSILAWSAYHLGEGYEAEGAHYMSKSLDFIQKTKTSSDSDTLQKLANLLIIAAAEICKGDVKKWPVFLEWGSKIIKQRGGLFNFKKDPEQRWLISNFAYHDILTSSSSERGTYFPVEDYENFMVNLGSGIDPLQGIVKPLFNIIGEVSSLAFETKRLLKISSASLGYGILDEEHGSSANQEDEDGYDDEEDDNNLFDIPGIDTPESEKKGKKVSRYTSLLTIMSRSSELENKINSVKPDPQDLVNFSPHDLELQLTLFELFQLTAKLHLRQSVLRLNPSSLETQFILCELLKCLDIVLKSSVEGSLCFPLFIAGMNCTTKKDRKMMLARFSDIIDRYSFKNLERAKTVMEQVWLIDPSGTKCVDWYEIVKKLNWDLSFA